MARLAEQAERWDDMVHYMKRVAGMAGQLNVEERNLFSVGFKNSITSRRTARRVMFCMESQQSDAISGAHITGYRQTVDRELDQICKDLIDILDGQVIRKTESGEPKVFFLKMKGDYYRYNAEIKQEHEHAACANGANDAYAAATAEAEANLGPAHPVRLGLMLNYAVFLNEIMGRTAEAMQLAKKTCEGDLISADLLRLPEDQKNDAVQILQLVQENLQLWAAGGAGIDMDGTAVEDM